MATTAPTFLTIPLELRTDIYLRLLNRWEPRPGGGFYSIFNVCRQTHEEALQVFLREPRYFRGFVDLYNWIKRANPVHLKFVKNISVRCNVEALAALRNATLNRTLNDPHREISRDEWILRHLKLLKEGPNALITNATLPSQSKHSMLTCGSVINAFLNWLKPAPKTQTQASDSEDLNLSIAAISEAFRSLSGLDKIWLNLESSRMRGREQTVHLCWSIEHRLCLEMITSSCSGLRELTLFSSLQPLSFLQNLKNLRLLRFNGYSLSSSEETMAILSSLKHLNRISLYRYPESHDIEYGGSFALYSNHISFTPACLCAMSPLVSFEISHMTSAVPSHFLTTAMVLALQNRHSNSLRELWIHNDGFLDNETVHALLNLTKASSNIAKLRFVLGTSSSLEHVELTDYLPDSLKEGGQGKASVVIRCAHKTIEYNPTMTVR